MASGVSVARSNTNNDYNQDYDSENNESKHNNLHPLSVRYSARFFPLLTSIAVFLVVPR